MHIKPFQCILTFLVLLGTAHAHVAPIAKCTVQAWVRAPDLAPDTIVRGDARVKISAGCPAIETVLLGLRLKERSFVKTLRSPADREWMRSARFDVEQASPWASPPAHFSNHSDDVKFDEILANKNLWLVREEERVVFEATRAVYMEQAAFEDYVVVQDFAVLVPSTNFPPALDYLSSGFIMDGDSMEVINIESIYEYFIRVSFANGTTEDISAGFTGFQPLYDPADTQIPSLKTVGLNAMHVPASGEYSPVTNYTARISGLVFTEGSEDQAATITITRTGPACIFTTPLMVRGCVEPTFSSQWAVEYDITMSGSQSMHGPGYVLRSTLEDVQDAEQNLWRPPCFFSCDGTVSITMPNSTDDEIQSHEIVTTTSAAVTIPIKIDRRQISNFETYYQTLANSLQITLETPCTADETVDPDDPSAEVPSSWGPDFPFPDDDEPWVPWEKAAPVPPMSRTRSWAGSVPAVVRPIGEDTTRWRCFGSGTDMSGQVVLQGEMGCEQHSSIHYLDDGARGPMFVDPSSIQELLAEDPAERELRAPILEPVVSSPPEGEEQVYRYYHHPDPYTPLIYVGETWAKKVANRSEQKVSSVY